MDARGARATVCPRSRVNFCRAGLLLRRLGHIVGKYYSFIYFVRSVYKTDTFPKR